MAPDFNIAAPPSNIFSPRPRAISRPSRHGEEVPVIHVGTAAFSQPQRQLDRLRLCLAQRSRRFKKTDIYLAAVLSYETMQGIVGYCFYMALWGTFTAGLWVGLLLLKWLWLDRMMFWLNGNLCKVQNVSGAAYICSERFRWVLAC